jgi:hypothetical protein
MVLILYPTWLSTWPSLQLRESFFFSCNLPGCLLTAAHLQKIFTEHQYSAFSSPLSVVHKQKLDSDTTFLYHTKKFLAH